MKPFTIVDDASAWLVKDYQGREDAYIYTFTPEDIQELDAAIAQVEQGGLRVEARPSPHIAYSRACPRL